MIKFYYTYDQETLIVNQTPISTTRFSGIPEYPWDALLVKPLPEKSGFVVRVCDFEGGRPTNTEYVEDHRGEVAYSTSGYGSTNISKLGPVLDGYTLAAPPETNQYYYEWDADTSSWVLSIDRIRTYKIQEINGWAANEKNSDDAFVSLKVGGANHDWDADNKALRSLNSVITSGLYPDYWTSYDNVDVSVSSEDIDAIHDAVVSYRLSIHDRQRTMKNEIESITDPDELLSYSVGW